MISPRVLKHILPGKKADFGKDVFPALIAKERFCGYVTAEYLKDMGTSERLEIVEKDFLSGRIERFNCTRARPAVFLDRDGVINKKVGLLYRIEDFELLPGASRAIKELNESDYLAIVVTNQPVVARNLCSEADVREIHKKMDTLLAEDGAKLDGVLFCPHHPDRGYPDENPEYKIECECRKPKTGMIVDSTRQFNINLRASFIIGDSHRDILCGKNAGLTTIAVRTGDGCRDSRIEPDFFFENIHEAVDFIVSASRG